MVHARNSTALIRMAFKFEGLREGNYTIVMNDDDFLDGSSPSDPLRIVIDRKGRCDEKAFAKMLDTGIKK